MSITSASREQGRPRGISRSLKGLQDRYLRRASFLLRDAMFQGQVAAEQEWWNSHYPDFQIVPVDDLVATGVPPHVAASQERAIGAIQGAGNLLVAEAALWEHMAFLNAWSTLVRRVKDDAFPPENFISPVSFETLFRSPLYRFAEVCLGLTRTGMMALARNEDKLRGLLPAPGLDLFPFPFADEDVSLMWCVPVYPEMTKDDWCAAWDTIELSRARRLTDLTVDARLDALHDEGMEPEAIAEALGVAHKTVMNGLRDRGRRDVVERPRARGRRTR